jgi:hypothetical protein
LGGSQENIAQRHKLIEFFDPVDAGRQDSSPYLHPVDLLVVRAGHQDNALIPGRGSSDQVLRRFRGPVLRKLYPILFTATIESIVALADKGRVIVKIAKHRVG